MILSSQMIAFCTFALAGCAGDTGKMSGMEPISAEQSKEGALVEQKQISAHEAKANNAEITGVRKLWQRIDLDFEGPLLRESPSTFRDYRLDVIFTHTASGRSMILPGYFAADGKAAYSSATKGTKWRAVFVPDTPGQWEWRAVFRTGQDIAIAQNLSSGKTGGYFDGATGKINISAAEHISDSAGFSGKGRIVHGDSHYASFKGSGELFLKTGAGSPENIFAYKGFDGTYDFGGTRYPALGDNQIHDFEPHINDFKPGDPDWGNGRSKGLIGAINYLSDVGVNAQYMVMMNVEGDGQDIWPWTGPEDYYSFDVSKLDQWQITMDHMDAKGILKDILFHETENESLLEAKEGAAFFSIARKLYYREMIARFGHNLGLTWNLGEEMGVIGNTGSDPWRKPTNAAQQLAFIRYIADLDAYDHPIVMHNWPDGENALYTPFLGEPTYSGISMQVHEDYEKRIIEWREKSAKAGRKWMIAVDEPLGWEFGARPDSESPDHDLERTTILWPVLLSGSAGIDWYFGWQNNAATSDLSNEDMRSRHNLWVQSAIARRILMQFPLHQMGPYPNLADAGITHVFAKPGHSYIGYLPSGGSGVIDISALNGDAKLVVYNPKDGSILDQQILRGGGRITIETHGMEKPLNKDRLFTIRKAD